MAVTNNAFAVMPADLAVTAAAVAFVETVRFEDIPAEALRIGTRCILDALGLYVAGSEEHSVHILIDEAEAVGGRADAALLGRRGVKVAG